MPNPRECCGYERDTPHCPQCGRKLRDVTPLESLCAHLEKTARGLRTSAKTCRKNAERQEGNPNPYVPERHRRHAEQMDLKAEQWEEWHRDLAALLAKEATDAPSA